MSYSINVCEANGVVRVLTVALSTGSTFSCFPADAPVCAIKPIAPLHFAVKLRRIFLNCDTNVNGRTYAFSKKTYAFSGFFDFDYRDSGSWMIYADNLSPI